MDVSEREELLEIAQEAYIWGSPLVMWAEYKHIRDTWYFPRNRPFGRLGIIDDDFAPAQELLYTLIDLDLSVEPQVLRVPPTGDRFFSIQFCDKFFNPFHYIGTRNGDTKGGDYAVCPPGWSGSLPDGVVRIDSPVDRIMTYGRTVMKGRSDADASIAVASQYAITGLSGYPDGFKGYFRGIPGMANYFPAPWKGDAEGIRFFDKLSFELASTPFPEGEQHLAERFRRVGVGPGLVPTELADKEMRAVLKEAVKLGQQRIDRCDAIVDRNGWRTPEGVGPTFSDFVLRANVQAGGGGYNIPEECMYYRAYDGADGEPLTGAKRYRIHFPAEGLPPVDAFWSIAQIDAKKGFPIPNPIKRNAISSIMDGLELNPDGSLTILLQKDEPEASDQGMWLPVGEDGFQLFLRLYLPRKEIVSGDWLPPTLEILD